MSGLTPMDKSDDVQIAPNGAPAPASVGIYIQVPFCQTKCTYCNFHTGVAARSLYAPYARAVVREISEHATLFAAAGLGHAAEAAESTVDTVYLGGGTPSLLDPSDLA